MKKQQEKEDNLDYSFGKRVPTKEEWEEIEPYQALCAAVVQLQPSHIGTRRHPEIHLRHDVMQANIANRDDILRYIKHKEKAPRDVFYNKMRGLLGADVSIKVVSVEDANKALSELMVLYDSTQDGETEYQNYKAFAEALVKGAVRGMQSEK